MSPSIYLVSCASSKRPIATAARDLYVSDLFLKARAFVEKRRAPWFVLSAEHGLLHPDTVVAPYDRTLNDMPISERRSWASKVLAALEPHLVGVERVIFLAGKKYREFLEPQLRSRLTVEVPMAHLGIGKQRQWLTRHTDSR